MFRGVVGVLIGMVVFAAVVSGCGGGDDDDGLTKAEFTKQASAICKQKEDEKNEALQAAMDDLEAQPGRGEQIEIKLIDEVALPPIVEMNEELGDLGLPEGEEEKAEAMLEAFEAEVEKIEANPKGVISGAIGEFTEANKLATELGAKHCAAI